MVRIIRHIVLMVAILLIYTAGVPAVTPTAAQSTPASTPEFKPELRDAVLKALVNGGFVPGKPKQGAVYVRDLATGQGFTVNGGKAFSAASVMKIAVMVALYRRLNTPLTQQQARTLADMMVCSENTASNKVIELDGNGDSSAGLAYINDTLAKLDLTNTFLWRNFYDDPKKQGPQTPPPPTTSVDQTETQPDPLNQSTPDEIGLLFGDIYQCALDGSGPLTTAFPNEITMDECRAMMTVMNADQLTVEIQAGIPAGTYIAQKTGVGNDIHNDAAIIMTPGGDYVIVEMMHNPVWLSYLDSFPVMAEVSRLVYNDYNPTAPLTKIRDRGDNSCKVPKSLLDALVKGTFPPLK
jgi:beta-lactamase class A